MPGKMSQRDEHLWKKAKSIVQKQYPNVAVDSERYWKLVQGVYKQSKGEKSMFASYPFLQEAMMKAKVVHENVGTGKLSTTNRKQKKEKSMFGIDYPILEKAQVRAHQRRSKSGKIVPVGEHERSGRAAQTPRVNAKIDELSRLSLGKLRALQARVAKEKRENYQQWQKAKGKRKKELESEAENLDLSERILTHAVQKKVFGKSVFIKRRPTMA